MSNKPADNPQQKSAFKCENLGLMVGLISRPFENQKEFIQREFKEGLFRSYKNGIKKNLAKGETIADSENSETHLDQIEKYLYNCRAYFIFGRFDIALLSLCDDFDLASRGFRPYNHINYDLKTVPPYSAENFDYQIITGPQPFIRSAKGEPAEDLLTKAKKTFLKTADEPGHYPFIGICQLKFNNSLLIGAGGAFSAYVLKYIHNLLSEEVKNLETNTRKLNDGPPVKMDFIISESFGFHEATVVFFSNSLTEIAKLVFNIRETNFHKLTESGILNEENYEGLKKETLCYEILENGAEHEEEEKILEGVTPKEINTLHLFSRVKTTYGFDFDYFESGTNREGRPLEEFMLPVREDDKVKLKTKWLIRPGHLNAVLKTFGIKKLERYSAYMGQGEIIFPLPKFNQTLQEFQKLKGRINKVKDHIIKLRSDIEIGLGAEEVPKNEDHPIDVRKHFYVDKFLKRQEIKIKDFHDIGRHMLAIGIPKVTSQRIVRIWGMYNSAVLDPMLYGFFIELDGYLKVKLKNSIERYRRYNGKPGFETYRAVENLNKLSEMLLMAHGNRYFSSHRFAEMTEFQADYGGGIQQLVSAYDAVYKALNSPFGEKDQAISFAYVTGGPDIYSTEHAIRLHFFHIYQPSVFFSIVGHECANFFLEKLLNSLNRRKSRSKSENMAAENQMAADFANYDKAELAENLNLIDYKFSYPLSNFRRNPKSSLVFKLPRKDNFYKRLEENPDFHVFLDHLKRELFDYLILDLINYYYIYNRDRDLFWFWQWSFFLQISIVYKRIGKIDLNPFILLFLRVGIILEMDEPGSLNEKFLSPNPVLTDFWNTFFEDGVMFIREFLEITEVKNWLNYFNNLAKDVVRTAHKSGEETDIDRITNSVKKQKSEILEEHLITGKVYPYLRNTKESKETKTQYTIKVIYAYLKQISIWSKRGKLNLLVRNSDDGSIAVGSAKKVLSDLVFDPLGGIFTLDAEVRREYFKLRTAVMKSFWDMGLVEKKKLFFPNKKD